MLREATILDLPFIHAEILDASLEGFFSRAIAEDPSQSSGMKAEIRSIIEHRLRPSGLMAQASVYESEQNPIGFVVLSAGPENKGTELWMATINKKYRGKGHGRRMLEEVLAHFEGKNAMLLARCAPEAEIMFRLLQQNGFRHVATGDEGYRGLMYER